MDLWPAYEKRRLQPDFGKERLVLDTGQRWNASVAQISDRCYELAYGKGKMLEYSEEQRYVIAKDITFDMLFTFYDVNTRNAAVIRCSSLLGNDGLAPIRGFFSKLRRPNIELRAIGLQSEKPEGIRELEMLRKAVGGHFIEIDILGNETRHIALDLKTGMSYSLLLLNRIYRPGELNNHTKAEDFQLLELSFE